MKSASKVNDVCERISGGDNRYNSLEKSQKSAKKSQIVLERSKIVSEIKSTSSEISPIVQPSPRKVQISQSAYVLKSPKLKLNESEIPNAPRRKWSNFSEIPKVTDVPRPIWVKSSSVKSKSAIKMTEKARKSPWLKKLLVQI